MDLYDNINDCKKATLTWYDYAKYKQHYHVLDSWQDIEHNVLNTYKQPKSSKIDVANAADPDGKYAELLAQIKPKFYKQTKEAVRNSAYFMFHKYNASYYVRIRDGKLALFCYLYNPNWQNSLADKLIIDPKFARRYARSDKKKWPVLGAMVRVYEKKYDGHAMDFYYSETKYLLQQISSHLPDCDFLVANKDNLVIKRDLTEPCEEIVGSMTAPLQLQFKFREYCPIFSYCWNERYADVPLPTPDDVQRIYKLYAPEKCNNLYLNIPDVAWADKKATAVFRGSFTGSSANVERNPRLHIAMLNHKWKYDSKYNEKNKIDGICYLDAGLSSKGGFTRGRKEIDDRYIRFVDENYWQYVLIEQLNHAQQAHHKYIFYIEGNASAYRAGFLFSMGSVVLWIKPNKYYLWFEPYLQDGINCVFIEHDLSNLAEKITWLKQNDADAEQIALAGRALYDKLLTREAIEKYAAQAIIAACNST